LVVESGHKTLIEESATLFWDPASPSSSSMSSIFPGEAIRSSNEDAEPMTAAVFTVYLLVLMVVFSMVYKLANSVTWQWIPSSCLYILAGMLVYGGICMRFNGFNPSFDPTFFFLALLPPVIFNSGLEVNIPLFFQNYLTIMVFANLGTIINAIVVGLVVYWAGSAQASPAILMSEGFSFGSVVSATDPVTTIAVFDRFKVDPNLYTIIVGVSVLDDAISVILFKIFNSFITGDGITAGGLVVAAILFLIKMFGSMVFGYALGTVFAHVIHCPIFQENKTLLSCISIFFLYFIYAVADAFYLSGIISSMLAGIAFQYFHRYRSLHPSADTHSHTNKTQRQGGEEESLNFERVRSLINQWAFLFECVVFVYIGLTVFYHPAKDSGDAAFVFWSFVACIVGRVAQIYPLSYLLNFYQKGRPSQSRMQGDQHVPVRMTEDSTHDGSQPSAQETNGNSPMPIQLTIGYQHMMMLAGLRGPIAYATSQWFSDRRGHQNMVAFTTTLIVIFTTAVFGALTMPGLNWFHISYGQEESDDDSQQSLKTIPQVSLPRYLKIADQLVSKAMNSMSTFCTCCRQDSHNNNSVLDISISSATEEGRGSMALSATTSQVGDDEDEEYVVTL
jgi:sodium/hydrogen exchanger 8